jgi:hypothetical protein
MRRGSNRVKSRDNLQDVETLIKSGKSITDIAKEKGYRHCVIQRYCNQNGIDYGKKKSVSKPLDGNRYDNYTILNLSKTFDAGEKMWNAQCDCGKIFTIRSSRIKNTPSCGCSDSEQHPKFVKEFEDMPDWFIQKFINGAMDRNIEYDISNQKLWDIYVQQDRKCVYTGLELFMPTKKTQFTYNASIDRIDSRNGYIEGNVQWVHKKVNMMKGVLSDQDFIDFCILVGKNRGEI